MTFFINVTVQRTGVSRDCLLACVRAEHHVRVNWETVVACATIIVNIWIIFFFLLLMYMEMMSEWR